MRKAHRANVRHIGWRETIALPDLGIPLLKAKIDTGARTSAIHAVDLQRFRKDGQEWISFRVPLPNLPPGHNCEAPIADERAIKNTSGRPETRYVIRTTLVLERRHWHIELSLANREDMGFDLILGRTAIRSHGLLVDPGRSFLCGLPRALPISSGVTKGPGSRNIQPASPPHDNKFALEEEE